MIADTIVIHSYDKFFGRKKLKRFYHRQKNQILLKSINEREGGRKGRGGGGETRAISKTFLFNSFFITACQKIRLKVLVPFITAGEVRDAIQYH